MTRLRTFCCVLAATSMACMIAADVRGEVKVKAVSGIEGAGIIAVLDGVLITGLAAAFTLDFALHD